MRLLRRHTPKNEYKTSALQADEYVRPRMTGSTPQLIHIDGSLRRSNQYGSFPFAVPSQSGNAAWELIVRFAGEDRIDNKRLETSIPKAAGLSLARIDVGCREGNVARIMKHCFAQRFATRRNAILNDRDDNPNELKRLLQTDGTQ